MFNLPQTARNLSVQKLLDCIMLTSLCLLTAACGDSGGSGGGSGDSKMSLSITDAPIYDAQKVEVDFSAVEVKPADGPARKYVFCENPGDPASNPPIVEEDECSRTDPALVTIDLLEQTGGRSYLLLDQVSIDSGRVNWVRLALADPAGRITLSTGIHELTVPSGNQTGLKLNRGFDVPEDGEAKIYIDFDVRKSIVESNGEYKLKPSLRLVEKFGAIAGEVGTGLVPATCFGPSIYVYTGKDVAPDDIERDKDDPISSAEVVSDPSSSTNFSYRADFLEPGNYTVAFVCADGVSLDGGSSFIEAPDDPDRDDTISFTLAAPTSSAEVVDGETQLINF